MITRSGYLDTVALVEWIVAGEVTIAHQLSYCMCARVFKYLVVAHLGFSTFCYLLALCLCLCLCFFFLLLFEWDKAQFLWRAAFPRCAFICEICFCESAFARAEEWFPDIQDLISGWQIRESKLGKVYCVTWEVLWCVTARSDSLWNKLLFTVRLCRVSKVIYSV